MKPIQLKNMKRTNCWQPKGKVWYQKNEDGGWNNPEANEKKFERFEDDKITDSNITKMTKEFKTRRY